MEAEEGGGEVERERWQRWKEGGYDKVDEDGGGGKVGEGMLR